MAFTACTTTVHACHCSVYKQPTCMSSLPKSTCSKKDSATDMRASLREEAVGVGWKGEGEEGEKGRGKVEGSGVWKRERGSQRQWKWEGMRVGRGRERFGGWQ